MQKSIKILIVIAFVCLSDQVLGNAYIEKLTNNTDFEFQVIGHSAVDECQVTQKNAYVIPVHQIIEEYILLGAQQPSFVMRPIAYIDSQSGNRYVFFNADFGVDNSAVEQAFNAWKVAKKQDKKYKTAQDWFADWVGGDVLLNINQVKVLGYVADRSRVVLGNDVRSTAEWIDWAQGVFSKLGLAITITEHPRKGIIFTVASQVSEGAYCSPDGHVERF